MANSVYQINKGINRSIEFKGLRAQYIWYLGAGILLLLMVYATMYIIGLPSILCVIIIAIAASGLMVKVYALSNKYGEYGMMKAIAKRSIPRLVKCNSRKIFIY
ncbi:MAG: DUF4133 domain-containing protein [Candidatus Pedobacter colombiensis]|uniref:DUF4133 domain-containing protein n=1 Tax=Candidatus Pedobacter colombiensis TaxID=3121371 RepID=A0AAJ5W3M4_9SPHI|nr:DUF4133 domain-containing protein [Pedobacter sp.]WEK17903.1 MAG: DUF4133 domain-containing protein [Pedobacter sp.]